MPFVAIQTDTNERIDITRMSNPRQVFGQKSFVCQLCEQTVFMRTPQYVRPHFFHKRGVCQTDYNYTPESKTHLDLKLALALSLREQYKNNPGVRVDIEAKIPEILRVADVLLTVANGNRMAYEIQLSYISPAQLEERTYDYYSLGIEVCWLLGADAKTDTLTKWVKDLCGFCGVLDVNRKEHVLRRIELDTFETSVPNKDGIGLLEPV